MLFCGNLVNVDNFRLPIQPPRLQKQFDLVDDLGEFFQDLLRPKAEDHIAHIPEGTVGLLIFLHVALDLGYPEPPVGMYMLLAFLPVVTVPELAIHEDGQPVFFDHNVRPAGKGAVVQTKADVFGPQSTAQDHLRLGVFPFDLGHIQAALRGGVESLGFFETRHMDAVIFAVVTGHRIKLRNFSHSVQLGELD